MIGNDASVAGSLRHREGFCAILMGMAAPKAYPVPHLARLRFERALSQAELAVVSGLGPATIARLELGRPARLATIRKLAAALGVTPAALLGAQAPERPERGAAEA